MFTPAQLQANLQETLVLMDEFASGTAPAQRAARKIAAKLQELGIPYVVAGGLAVGANGYMRATVDVDLILTRQGLARFKEHALGVGWVEKFKGSKGMKDAEFKVDVDVLTPDEKPGDGKTCPFNFPSPESLGQEVGGIWSGLKLLPLRDLIELKLASGITLAGRLKDLADVQELIKANRLPKEFEGKLHPFVQSKYRELWSGAQVKDPYEEKSG
ncbi:MAG: hypothetical protein IT452_02545 [Planctomycetia bacterium]|nr:hypothetical protein [Planctomycetia bacterium]